MSEIKGNPHAFKEAVCIEALRIYDSCSDIHTPPYIFKKTSILKSDFKDWRVYITF